MDATKMVLRVLEIADGFAAIDIFSRIGLFIVYSVTKNALFFPLASLIIVIAYVILLCNLQPYKSSVSHYLKIDVTFYLLLALYYAALSGCETASLKQYNFVLGMFGVVCLFAFIPLLYMSCLAIYWIFSRKKMGKNTMSID